LQASTHSQAGSAGSGFSRPPTTWVLGVFSSLSLFFSFPLYSLFFFGYWCLRRLEPGCQQLGAVVQLEWVLWSSTRGGVWRDEEGAVGKGEWRARASVSARRYCGRSERGRHSGYMRISSVRIPTGSLLDPRSWPNSSTVECDTRPAVEYSTAVRWGELCRAESPLFA
jgi:hypothetical protein